MEEKKIEIIVQDRGSKPEILNKINEVLGDHDRLVSENDGGIFDAINKGISHSRNELILTLGADDRISHSSVLSSLQEKLINPETDFVCGSIVYADEQWSPIRHWFATLPGKRNIFFGRQVAHFGFVAKRKVYQQLGMFSEKYKVSSDFDFFCRVTKSNFKGEIQTQVIVDMKIGGNSNKSFSNILKGNFEILLALLNNFGPHYCCILFSNHFGKLSNLPG